MKNLLKNTTSLFMILILLVSTLNISIYKMECLMSGNTTVSLSDFEDCSNTSTDNCSLSETCCCFHQMNLDFDYHSNISLKSITQIPTITLNTVLVVVKPIIKNLNLNSFTNLPPPSGFDLLKIVQVFRL